AWLITGWQAEARKEEAWVFVVRRKGLDKHYPAVTAATPIERQPDDEHGADDSKRKPGRKITGNWRLEAAAEMHRIRKDEGKTPSAPELCEFCDTTLGYYPDESEMRRLIRFLLGE